MAPAGWGSNGGRRSPQTLPAVERLRAQPAEHGDGQRGAKGSCSSAVHRGGFGTLASPLLGLTWSSPFLHQESSGICAPPKEGALRRGGAPPGTWPSAWPARCWEALPLRGACCPHPTARPCFSVSGNDHSLPLPPCEGLSAVPPPAEVLNQSPDSRGHRASYPLAQGPRKLIADFPQCFLGHNTRSRPTLLPPLCRRQPVTCPSGKERGAAALACAETEKQVAHEGVAELPRQLRGGGAALGKKKTQICSP